MFVLQSYNLKPRPPPRSRQTGLASDPSDSHETQAEGPDGDPKAVLPALRAEVPGSVCGRAGAADSWLQPTPTSPGTGHHVPGDKAGGHQPRPADVDCHSAQATRPDPLARANLVISISLQTSTK